MKHIYLLLLSILLISSSFAAQITATLNNGLWRNNSTWNLNRMPQNGDTINIPAGIIVVVSDWQNLNNVSLRVSGTIKFTNFFSALNLNSASAVIVNIGGIIQATLNYLQYIFIGTSTVFRAGQITGPQQANSTTGNGFMNFSPLPVKFVGFTLSRKNKDVLIQWSTAQEMNSERFDIERSLDGTNWNSIGVVTAAGNSSILTNYSYTDKNVSAKTVYYRIKEVDIDGMFVYTPVKTIKTETVGIAEIKIASVQNKVLLQFPNEIKGMMQVRFVSLSGQVVDEQRINNPVGQVVLNSKVTGNYVISVTNGQNVNVSAQVIL